MANRKQLWLFWIYNMLSVFSSAQVQRIKMDLIEVDWKALSKIVDEAC